MNTKKSRIDLMIYILFVFFYFWLAAQIPYTHDDWDWGLDIGIQQWLTASVNSRYVGNFFEVIMTRSPALKTLIMGGGFFAIPYLLSAFASKFNSEKNDHRLLLFLAANFLMLTMSRKIWSETYGWVAGFANFSISSIFMLLCFAIWAPLLEQEYTVTTPSKGYIVLCFLLSLVCQLFIENLSILMAVLSIAACVVSYIRAKRIPSHYLLMAAGTMIGLLIMFSSSVYSSLLETGQAVDGYRQLIISTDGSIMTKLLQFFTHCARLAVRAGETNTVLCVSVLLVLTYQIKRSHTSVPKLIKRMITYGNAILLIYFIVNFVLQSDYSADSPVRAAIAAMVNAIYFMAVLIEVFVLYKHDKVLRKKLIILWCCAIGVLAPLLVTTEAGYRLIFTPNVIIVLFILTIVHDSIDDLTNEQLRNPLKICIIGVLVPVLVCFHVYTEIGSCTAERTELIKEASDSDAMVLILPQYPYEKYLHYPDPSMEYRWAFFREFYGIANDVEIIIEPIN